MTIREQIKGNEREVKDVFYLIALQGLNYLAPVIVIPYLISVLNAESYGYIGFSLSVCTYLLLFVDFGFNLSATKRLSVSTNDKKEFNRIFSATFHAKMILLVVAFLLVFLLSLIPQFTVYRYTMFAMFLTVVGNAFLFTFLFQAIGEIKWISILNAISKLLILPLTFILVKDPNDYITAALIQGSVYCFSAVMSLIMIYKKKWVSLVKVSFTRIKKELQESFPIFVSQTATSIYTALFVVVLGYFSSPSEVGLYSAVDKIMRALCCLGLIPVLQAFYPKVAKISVNNYSEARALSKKLLVGELTLMTILSFVLFFTFPFMLKLLGEQYTEAKTISHIISLVPIFVGASGVLGQIYLLATGGEQDKHHFERTYTIASILAIVLIFCLTPRYKSIGTAVSLLFVEAFVAILMAYYVKKQKK